MRINKFAQALGIPAPFSLPDPPGDIQEVDLGDIDFESGGDFDSSAQNGLSTIDLGPGMGGGDDDVVVEATDISEQQTGDVEVNDNISSPDSTVQNQVDWEAKYRELEQSTRSRESDLNSRLDRLERGLTEAAKPSNLPPKNDAQTIVDEDPQPDPWDHPDEYVKWYDRQKEKVQRQERAARAQTEFNSRMKAGERRLRQQPERWAEYERLVINNPEFRAYLEAHDQDWREIYTDIEPAEAALEIAQRQETYNPKTVEERIQKEAKALAEKLYQEKLAATLGKKDAKPFVSAPKGTIANLPAQRPDSDRKRNTDDMDNNEFNAFFAAKMRRNRA